MDASTTADRFKELTTRPVPRKVRRRHAPWNDPEFMLWVAWIVFFGATFWWTLTLARVSWFGRDFTGAVPAISESNPQNSGQRYQDATILISMNDKTVEFHRTLSSSSSLKLHMGDKLTVRCIPHAPLFYPLILSHGEGTGWEVAWRLFWFAVVLGFLPLCLLMNSVSRGERLLLTHGQAAIGQITLVSKSDTGKVASASYVFTKPEFPETPFQGTLSVAETADSSWITVQSPVIVFYDPSNPEWNTAYDDTNGKFEID